ncbi:MAG: PAS domain-containing protein [Candidatus Didemnitutus sp.]|nr:PAS domain-containing protein [Candidatus Didemnitutus sp.]
MGRPVFDGRVLSEFFQDRAAQFVSGTMSAAERESFEVIVAFDAELGAHVSALQEAASALTPWPRRSDGTLPIELKARILAAVDSWPQQREREAFVVTDPAGRVEWVNDAFTALCGYTLDELRGRKPGALLQGAETDRAAVGRLRGAQRAGVGCNVELVNYHKDGSRYRVAVRMSPFLDEAGTPRWFVARERKLA